MTVAKPLGDPIDKPLGRRRLGRTEHESSLAVLGGAMFWQGDPAETEEGFRLAAEHGINHLDVAPQYGEAEVQCGPYLEPVRDDWFVAGKTMRANPDGVRSQLATTLERLRTDHLDLYQAHAVTSLEELDRRSPALEAICQARDEGLTRFVGTTGHDLGTPKAQLEAIRRFDIDTVMFPIYPRLWCEPQYRADAEELLAEAQQRDVGVMIIKSVAHKPWGNDEKTELPWYRPWTTPSMIERGIRFALSTPGVTAICTPGDVSLLPMVIEAVAGFTPMTDIERDEAAQSQADAPLIFPLAENVNNDPPEVVEPRV